jgi:hypothetical protein
MPSLLAIYFHDAKPAKALAQQVNSVLFAIGMPAVRNRLDHRAGGVAPAAKRIINVMQYRVVIHHLPPACWSRTNLVIVV